MEVVAISLAAIQIPPGRRAASPARVKQLADSILAVGLLHPIGVTAANRLIYGRGRMEAYRLLGWNEIPACVHPMDDLHADLAEIDENLQRCQLTALEEAQAMKRRKEIYEALHPEAKHGGGAPGIRGKPKRQNDVLDSFTADTAAKTGKSRRTVERAVALAEDLPEEIQKIIAETPIADNASELRKLAKLPADEQRIVAECIRDGEAASVKEALTSRDEVPPPPPTKSPAAQFKRAVLNLVKASELSLAVAAAVLENLAVELRERA